MAVRVPPESMPVPPVPTMMPAESVDPVVQIPYHELPGKTTLLLWVGRGLDFCISRFLVYSYEFFRVMKD